ncbi:MAG: DUF3530 family protein [Pseudomonadota bacterium]
MSRLYFILSLVFATPYSTYASINHDIYTQLQVSDYTVVDVDGSEKPVITFDSNLAETRGTVVFFLDENDRRLSGFIHQLSFRLPTMGLSTVLYIDNISLHSQIVDVIQDIDEQSAVQDNTTASEIPKNDETTPLDNQANTENTENTIDTQWGSFAALNNAKVEQTDTNEALVSACKENLKNKIDSLYDALDIVSQRTIILTSGATSGCLFQLENIPADALITLNPFIDDIALNKQLSKKIAATTQPVLDLVNMASDPISSKSAMQRRISSTRALKAHYRQREIIGHDIGRLQVDYVAKEIYGWLTYLGY